MKLFISSTYVDLIEHRKAAHDALERSGQEVGRMDIFGTRATEAGTVALDKLKKSELAVRIYTYRYEFIPEGAGTSMLLPNRAYALAMQYGGDQLRRLPHAGCRLGLHLRRPAAPAGR